MLDRAFHDFLTRLPRELGLGTEDAAQVVDRYYTPDITYRNDGVTLDRDRLIAHAAPARKNARELHLQVHDTVIQGERAAARYTLRVRTRKDKTLEIEVCLFATFAPDGRVRRVDSTTRTVTEKSPEPS
ncbi:nuclear transport factor 2 family protein [Nonomuraea sp. NPDC047897]|uniref:nuclear transport factor 2 family protein n=1 Tax=Nonomuraea sp. NPDC047897 TaxID=3364346 RepID=UPI0037212CAC